VQVWDDDPGGDSANDLIGSTDLKLEEYDINPEEDWGEMAWFELQTAKGNPAGEVLLYLRWDASLLLEGKLPPPGSSALWHLTVDLLECDGLPRMDFSEPNDPYVEISVDGAKERMHRSTTIYGGGGSPKWLPDIESPGERMLFELMEPPPSIGLVVYDEDKNTKDDLVGDNLIELGKELLGQAWGETKVVTLTDRKGHVRGTIKLKISWGPAPESSYILACTVLSCRNLKARDHFSENDVFARAVVNGSKRLTPVVYKRNNPVWDPTTSDTDGRRRRLEWELSAEPKVIMVEAWDKDTLTNDDLIGTAVVAINVTDIVANMAEDATEQDDLASRPTVDLRRGEGGVVSQWHTLLNPAGKDCGEIEVSFEWQTIHEEKSKGQSVISRVMRNTKAMKRAVRAMIAQRRMDATKWTTGRFFLSLPFIFPSFSLQNARKKGQFLQFLLKIAEKEGKTDQATSPVGESSARLCLSAASAPSTSLPSS